MWGKYRDYFKSMQEKTYYSFDYSDDEWESGYLIYKVSSTKHYFNIYFSSDYIELLQGVDKYMIMFYDDILKFQCKHTTPMYQFLRSLNKHPQFSNYYDFTTKELKELFGLTLEDYTNKKTGVFKRHEFEKKTINNAIDEINEKATLIKNVKCTKIKRGPKVAYYHVTFENVQLVTSTEDDTNVISIDPINFISVDSGDYLDYDFFRNALKKLEPITNAQIREIYELASQLFENENSEITLEEKEFKIYEYLRHKMVQLEAYPKKINNPRGLLKKLINIDVKEKQPKEKKTNYQPKVLKPKNDAEVVDKRNSVSDDELEALMRKLRGETP